MIRLLKKNRKKKELLLHLNMPLQPIHRQHLEDELQKLLKKENLGKVMGGGTMMNEQLDEIKSCDIQIDLYDDKDDAIDRLVSIINETGISKGSELICEDNDQRIEVGTLEGLAYYNNATELPQEVYESCDINHLIEEMLSAMKGVGGLYSFWESDKWTILYFYGNSFEEMKQKIEPIITTYPLCRKSKIERL